MLSSMKLKPSIVTDFFVSNYFVMKNKKNNIHLLFFLILSGIACFPNRGEVTRSSQGHLVWNDPTGLG